MSSVDFGHQDHQNLRQLTSFCRDLLKTQPTETNKQDVEDVKEIPKIGWCRQWPINSSKIYKNTCEESECFFYNIFWYLLKTE